MYNKASLCAGPVGYSDPSLCPAGKYYTGSSCASVPAGNELISTATELATCVIVLTTFSLRMQATITQSLGRICTTPALRGRMLRQERRCALLRPLEITCPCEVSVLTGVVPLVCRPAQWFATQVRALGLVRWLYCILLKSPK